MQGRAGRGRRGRHASRGRAWKARVTPRLDLNLNAWACGPLLNVTTCSKRQRRVFVRAVLSVVRGQCAVMCADVSDVCANMSSGITCGRRSRHGSP